MDYDRGRFDRVREHRIFDAVEKVEDLYHSLTARGMYSMENLVSDLEQSKSVIRILESRVRDLETLTGPLDLDKLMRDNPNIKQATEYLMMLITIEMTGRKMSHED